MKIYTRTGDSGDTSLFGGARVRKNNTRIDAYGTVDELNAVIGVVRASWPGSPIDADLSDIQSDLFDLGAHLAAPTSQKFNGVPELRIAELERGIDRMESELTELKSFILPGGSLPASHLHVARTVCRRAERLLVTLDEDVVYLNRLSDFLFVAARYANKEHGVEDVLWTRT